MEILFVGYLIIGLLHANNKINNPNPMRRPIWASDKSLPFILRVGGFLLFAILWPISMLLP